VKAGWEVRPLGEVVVPIETIDPTKRPSTQFTYVDVSSVSNETFEIVQTSQVFGSAAPSRARRLIRTNDVIFATIRPTLKRIASVPSTLDQQVCSTGYMVLRTLPKLHPRFLFHYLFTDQFQGAMEELQTGASYPAVTDGQVRQQPITLPPLEEQQRIVAILDEAFEGLTRARAHAEANLQNARELFPAFLTAAFNQASAGWITKKLEELCEKITDGTHQTPKYSDGGYLFLSSRNVTSGTIDWQNIKYVDAEQHQAMQKRLSPKVGDVLLAKNGTTGVAAIVDRNVPFNIYVSLALLRTKNEITPEFLLYFTNSSLAKEQFNSRLKGSGVPNLHLEEIRQVRMPYPSSKAEQDRLVQLFDQQRSNCLEVVERYAAKLKSIDALRQSLLQKAFAGELT